MTEQRVTFTFNGLTLAGVVRVPEGTGPSERRAAFMVLHGFGSNMTAGNVLKPCAMLDELGYATLRFDMPGCGESEGEKGRLICLEQVGAVSEALSMLARYPQIDPARIGVIGSSFWAAFTAMLEEGKRHRAQSGQSLMVPRYDIVPIPPEMRGHLAAGSVQMFPAETAQSMFDFRAEDVVGKIAPRPLLLLHSAHDHVTPTEQSVAMFERAGEPTELHLFADTDHFMFAEGNTRVRRVVQDWLAAFFPA